MPHLGLVQRLMLTAILGGAVGTAVATAWWYVGRRSMERLRPAPRLRRLVGMAAAPLIGALGLTGVAVLPSVLHTAGIAADHCGAHPAHHVHLCPVHTSHVGHAHASILGWIAVGVAALWFAVRAFAAIRERWRALRALNTLQAGARYDADRDTWIVEADRPFAVAVGFFAPSVLVSDTLQSSLSDDQMQVVRAHERVHARRRHTLLQTLVELAGIGHLAPVRAYLREEVGLACEQIADREAAERTDDAVEVADTILGVEKLMRDDAPRAPRQPAIDGSDLERRVVGLLDEPWERTARHAALVGAVSATLVVAWSYETVHHGLETFYSIILS